MDEVTIKHKCQGKVVWQRAKKKKYIREIYNEHADMHYDGGGWFKFEEIFYEIDNCKVCGGYHNIKKKK